MTDGSDFHLQFKRDEQTFDLHFREKSAPTETTACINGRYYAVDGDSAKINWLRGQIPELKSNISMVDLKTRLQHLGAQEIRSLATEKTHSVGVRALDVQSSSTSVGKWRAAERQEVRAVAEKYWEKCVDGQSNNDHAGLLSFLKSCGKYCPATPTGIAEDIQAAIRNNDKAQFVALFDKLEMWQAGQINHVEGLNAFSPPLPRDTNKTTFTPADIQEVRQYMKDSGFSGVVSISDKTGTHTLTSKDINSNTPFAMHSIGKVFTGVLVLKMIQEGILSEKALHEPVQLDPVVFSKLPETVKEHLTKNGAPTLLDLMLHQSGLGDYLSGYVSAIGTAIQTGASIPAVGVPEDFLKYADAAITPLKKGETHYSNLGILLVGLSVQHMYNQAKGANKSYHELLNEVIVGPAKLTTFSEKMPEGAIYNERDAVAPHIAGGPAGGYWISAEDLMRFGKWTVAQGQNARFNELLKNYGGEFQPVPDEISHSGAIDSSNASLRALPNGITIAILSNRPYQADLLNDMIGDHILSTA